MLTQTDAKTLFDSAARVFGANPSPDTLAVLTGAARVISEANADAALVRRLVSRASVGRTPPVPIGWASPVDFSRSRERPGDFQEIRATFDRLLTSREALNAAGAIGYALRIYLAGEELSEPQVFLRVGDFTELAFTYDATKARRSSPDIEEAFDEAARFIVEGSPIRKTNRAGRQHEGQSAR